MDVIDRSFRFDGGLVRFDHTSIEYEMLSSFHIFSRNIVYGRNGSGKSTLLRCISGIIPEIYQAEVDIKIAIGEENLFLSIPNEHVNVLTQNTEEFLFGFSVEEELMFSRNKGKCNGFFECVIEQLDLKKLYNRYSFELSEGEKQRLAIACCLLQAKPWILFDEWTSHLDSRWIARVDKLLSHIVAESNISTIELTSNTPEISEENSIILTTIIKKESCENNRIKLDIDERLERLSILAKYIFEKLPHSKEYSLKYNGNLNLTEDLKALEEFSIPCGSIGILHGPNGAGKTTLAKRICAYDCNNKKWRPTFVLSNPSLQLLGKSLNHLLRNILIDLSYISIEKVAKEISTILGITEDSDLLELNTASIKILTVIAACFSTVPVIVIDEPLVGLDFETKRILILLLDLFASLRNGTVLITSPDSEIEFPVNCSVISIKI